MQESIRPEYNQRSLGTDKLSVLSCKRWVGKKTMEKKRSKGFLYRSKKRLSVALWNF